MMHQPLVSISTHALGAHAKKIAKAGLIGAILLLSACSILPKSEPQTRYNLPAITMQPLNINNQKNTALYVAVPQANRLINSNYVLVQPDGTEIQVYKGAQWADNAPVLLRDRLIQALNDTQLFNAISADAAINTPWSLTGYLQHFEVQYRNGEPVVNLQYEGQLVNRHDSSIVRNQRFVITQPAADTNVPAVIDAFGLAGDKLSSQLIDWLKSVNF